MAYVSVEAPTGYRGESPVGFTGRILESAVFVPSIERERESNLDMWVAMILQSAGILPLK